MRSMPGNSYGLGSLAESWLSVSAVIAFLAATFAGSGKNKLGFDQVAIDKGRPSISG
jgi:hypothetical protein